MDSYRTDAPEWDVLLDLDALGEKEGENWVWDGASCLPGDTRCLIGLSRGGADAAVKREFDLKDRRFVEGGFELPEAKSRVSWQDRDHLFVATDFGEGSLTDSGYPRIVKRWTRGTPLTEATTVFEGEKEDISVGGSHDFTEGFERDFVYRGVTFYTNQVFELVDGKPVQIEKPTARWSRHTASGLCLSCAPNGTRGDQAPRGFVARGQLRPLDEGQARCDGVVHPDR